MASARFYLLGGVELSHTVLINEAISKNNLEGSVISMRANKLAIVVEGAERNIRNFYKSMNEDHSHSVVCTELEFRRIRHGSQKDQSDGRPDEIFKMLHHLYRQMIQLNRKVDMLMDGKVDYLSYKIENEPTSSDSTEDDTPYKTYDDPYENDSDSESSYQKDDGQENPFAAFFNQ